jgi:nicotinamide mononucleotide transporter
MDWKLALQIIGVCLGLLYLLLEYRASIYLWVVGLVMPVVHGVLYYQSGLYADMGMNAYYVVAGLYGWLVWHNRPRKSGISFPITRTPARLVVPLVGIAAVAFVAIWWVLTRYTDSTVPVWDALTTALSVVAMWMLSRKYVEQWLVWLVVDMISCGLYIYKGIPFTAGLYGLYSVLAVAGYFRWLGTMRRTPETA